MVPESWFEPVVGLWVVLLAGFGMQMALYHGGEILRPLGGAPWAAVVVTVLVAAIAYGGFGIGLTRAYRTYRCFEPRFVLRPLDRDDHRSLVGLPVLGLVLMVLGGTWSNLTVVSTSLIGIGLRRTPMVCPGSPSASPASTRWSIRRPSWCSARCRRTPVGPAAGALVHGVLQDTLADVAPPVVTVAVTAGAAAIVSGYRTVTSPTTVVVLGFVLGVAYACRATENLVVVMAAYGLFNVLALLLEWLDSLTSLHAHGHLW